MKKLLLLLVWLPLVVNAQFAVIDVGTNTQLLTTNTTLVTISGGVGTANANILKVNANLLKTNILLKEQNAKLGQLINLLNTNNQISAESKVIHSTELNAKKMAPSYVISSAEVQKAIRLKDKIVSTYNISMSAVDSFEYISPSEKDDFIDFIGTSLSTALSYFNNSRQMLTTTSIIAPEERLKKIDDINGQLNNILDDINRYARKLKSINQNKKSGASILNMNSNRKN